MPNSLEAERSVIASMLMNKDAIVNAMEILQKEDFYHQQYGIVFEPIAVCQTCGAGSGSA